MPIGQQAMSVPPLKRLASLAVLEHKKNEWEEVLGRRDQQLDSIRGTLFSDKNVFISSQSNLDRFRGILTFARAMLKALNRVRAAASRQDLVIGSQTKCDPESLGQLQDGIDSFRSWIKYLEGN